MNDDRLQPFANDPVRPSDMPDYRGVAFEPVAPSFRRYTLTSSLVGWAPFLLAPLVMQLLGRVPAWLVHALAAALVALTLLIALHRWIDAGFRGWALRTHDLIARGGILWRSETVLPFARIQHVETTSGPLERFHGLARLKLYTAGGMTADLTVVGLTGASADRLREHLVEQIRLRDAGAVVAAPNGVEPGAAPGLDPGDVEVGEHESA